MDDKSLLTAFLRSGDRERKLRARFQQRGTELIQLYRHGPYKLVALFKLVDAYWTISCSVDRDRAWTQDTLDRQLDDDLIGELDRWFAHKHACEWAGKP